MEFRSEALWNQGTRAETLRETVLKFLESNPDTFYTVDQVAGKGLNEDPMPDPDTDLSGDLYLVAVCFTKVGSVKTELVLDQLVQDGIVEKRTIKKDDIVSHMGMDDIYIVGVPKEVQEESQDELSYSWKSFYRIAQK